MKVIVAGSRTIVDTGFVFRCIDSYDNKISEIVSGGARGPDTIGEIYANTKNIPVKHFLADWKRLGRRAGHVRNEQMGDYADALIAIWDGESSGTNHMINYMKKLGKPVHIYRIDKAFLF